MIKFTDPNLYAMGTCAMTFADTNTGNIVFWSDKVQNFSDVPNANEVLIRAGLTNGIACVMTTDSERTVTAVCANFSMMGKAMKVGATLQYNGIAPVCKVITASGTSLTVDVSDGVPVANYGYSSPVCYVQETGAASPIATFGNAYAINASTGAITGFTSVSGKKYKVWYFVRKAAALEAAMPSNFQPGVYHATAQIAVYRNMTGANPNEGTRVGWLYCIYPRYKMTVGGGINGEQTNADTTDLSGRPLPMDADVVSDQCVDCESGMNAYYLYVPDDTSTTIQGILGAIGGVVTVEKSTSSQIMPYFIMENGQLVKATTTTGFTFALTDGPSGTTVSTSGAVTAGSTTGSGALAISYANGTETLTDACTLTVV